ncbi:hypothetical protein HDV00_010387 [Rhizophlyctis rosea]|nr:hypothetical protein HDV00_010387 [Rhizophlyctis rosea]
MGGLTKQDQSGTQDTWNNYFEIGGKADFSANFTFTGMPLNTTAFSLAVSYRGSAEPYQHTTFALVDINDRSETLIFSTGTSDGIGYTTDWVWAFKTGNNVTGNNLGRFITSAGSVTVVLRVKTAEAIDLDYLALIAQTDGAVSTTTTTAATSSSTTTRSTTTIAAISTTTTNRPTTTNTTTTTTTTRTITTSAVTTTPTNTTTFTSTTTTPSTTTTSSTIIRSTTTTTTTTIPSTTTTSTTTPKTTTIPSTTTTTTTTTRSTTTSTITVSHTSTSSGAAWTSIPTRISSSPSWAQYARVADVNPESGNGDSASQSASVQTKVSEYVSVAEIDGSLSGYYTTDSSFVSTGIAPIASYAKIARKAGLRTVAYYPALEVIADVPSKSSHSMCRDNPSWVQISVDGTKTVFEGSGVVFWVEEGQESCWPSPNSPWRDVFLRRVALLADPQNQIDGLWPDVPIYFDGVSSYADFSTWGKAAFTNATGLSPPAQKVDWSNSVWRRWIAWRHENLRDFLIDVHNAGVKVNSDWQTVVEIVTCDYNDATRLGLDGAYLKNVKGLSIVWEVDAMSDDSAMRNAKADDWLMMYAMMKYGRGASGSKPSWAFDYGKQTDDAQAVLALAVTAGNSPYEVKIPTKEEGVDSTFRTKWYSWLSVNQVRLLGSTSLARIAIYHSSASRDFTEEIKGNGMYITTTKPSGLSHWWSEDSATSATAQTYLGEYRGAVKALARNHLPFDTLTSPYFSASELLPSYTTFVAPGLIAVSDAEVTVLIDWVKSGGNLVVTGAQPLTKNEYGDARSQSALSAYLTPATGSGVASATIGKGSITHYAGGPFRSYLTNTTLPSTESTLINQIQSLSRSWVRIPSQSQPQVLLDLKGVGNEIVVSLVNLSGGNGSWSIVPVNVTVQFDTRKANADSPFLTVPAGAVASSPDDTGDVGLSVTSNSDGSTFSVTLTVKVMKLLVLKF